MPKPMTSATAPSVPASIFDDPLFALLPEADQAMFRRPFARLVRAGQFLGPGRNTSYKAAKAGDIPTVDICGQKFVSTAWLWETWRRGRVPDQVPETIQRLQEMEARQDVCRVSAEAQAAA